MIVDKTVRLIALQFSFSNPKIVPPSVRGWKPERKPETPGERAERKSNTTGEVVLAPTENCSITEFLGKLEATGYELVDTVYEPRTDPKDPRGKRIYHTVRFIFARSEFVQNLFPGFLSVRNAIYEDLANMACEALWRVRALSNPLYTNGESVQGQSALSINFEVRRPLFKPDGSPEVMRQKDAAGNPVGEPLPIEPGHVLRLDNDELRLEPFPHTI